MARVTDKGIIGAVGPVIFYSMNGKTYARSMPKKRKNKRSPAEKNLNSIFGTVSKYGTAMIKFMNQQGVFLFPFGRHVYNKLRGWMRNLYAANVGERDWELSARTSGMCQLVEGIDLRDFWKTEIIVDDVGNGTIIIKLPEFNPKKDLKVPIRTMKVNLKLAAVTSTFKEMSPATCTFCTQHSSFEYSNNPVPAKQFVLQTTAGTGDIALVVMALEFETTDSGKGSPNKELRWLPAAVIAMGRLK
jgi:hypothetical protein